MREQNCFLLALKCISPRIAAQIYRQRWYHMGNTVRIFSTKYIQCNSSHSSINISILYSLQISNRHDTRIEFHLLATDWIDRKICHCLNMVTWENKSSRQNIYKWELRPCIINWWEEIEKNVIWDQAFKSIDFVSYLR